MGCTTFSSSKVDRSDVAYPSITICPESHTIKATLRSILEEHADLKAEKYPISIRTVLQLQMERIHKFYWALKQRRSMKKGHVSKSRNRYLAIKLDSSILLKCQASQLDWHRLFCGLYSQVLKVIQLDFRDKKTFFEKVKTLVVDTKGLTGLPSQFLVSPVNPRYGKGQPKDIFERHKVGLATDWDVAYLYLRLKLTNLLYLKSINQSVNVLEEFLTSFKGNQAGRNQTAETKSNKTKTDSQDEKSFNGTIDLPRLHHLVTWSDLNKASQQISPKLSLTLDYELLISQCNFLKCDVAEMFGFFVQLIYIHQFQFEEQPAANLVDLLSLEVYNSDLPKKTILAYHEEINREQKQLVSKLIGINNPPWSLMDAMEIFATIDRKYLKLKASWSHFKTSYSNRKFLTGRMILSSLSDIESTCISRLKPEDDPCQKEGCQQYCDSQRRVFNEKTMPKWERLLRKINHPSVWGDSANGHQTWLVPFCYHGEKLYRHTMTLKTGKSYNFSSADHYGYKFCDNAQPMMTDRGYCTTFNPPEVSHLYRKSVVGQQFRTRSKGRFGQTIYPDHLLSGLLNGGLLLILDSWAFHLMASARQDVTTSNTEMESIVPKISDLNSFRILIHGQDTFPMFQDSASVSFVLSSEEKLKTPRAHYVAINAKISNASQEIRSEEVAVRGCKFRDETDGLRFFNVYTKENCMLECKVNAAKASCNCTPWDFPHNDSERVCDMKGNLCFKEQMFSFKMIAGWKKKSRQTCQCYPSCR